MTTPWTVTPEWAGQTAVILASGPSLTLEQCELVRGCRVIAVNNQGIDCERGKVMTPAWAPWADILFSADVKWWKAYEAQARAFAGRKVTIRRVLQWPEVYSLDQSHQRIFDERPTHLVSGGNSGYMAIHLAVHLGAKRVLLLGFDMKDGKRGRRHSHDDHPGRLNSRGNYSGWMTSFGRLAPVLKGKGVDVVNCSPDTALKVFRREPLERVLDEFGHAASPGHIRGTEPDAGPFDRRTDDRVGACV